MIACLPHPRRTLYATRRRRSVATKETPARRVSGIGTPPVPSTSTDDVQTGESRSGALHAPVRVVSDPAPVYDAASASRGVARQRTPTFGTTSRLSPL